jgi:hypothetical protein
VGGVVIFLVAFKLSGEVEDVELLGGPKLLQIPATNYVKGLCANEYGGTRTCPIVVRYVIQPDGMEPDPIEHSDLQHATVYALLRSQPLHMIPPGRELGASGPSVGVSRNI